MQDSNLRPIAYEANALPTELIYRGRTCTSEPRITTAAQVLMLYSIANMGNSVFIAQIVNSGPTAISTTSKIIRNNVFIFLL